MKIDLRNNMLDEAQQKKSQKVGMFNGLFGNKKKIKKLETHVEPLKKIEAPKKIKKLLEPEDSFQLSEDPGIGQSDFQSKKEVQQEEQLQEQEQTQDQNQEEAIGEKNFNQTKGTIEQDYQRDVEYPYQKSDYIEESPEKILIKWQGPDHESYPKSKRWYTIAGFVLASLVTYAVLTNSPLTAIVFILIGIVGYMYLERDPQLTDFAVSYDGVVIGNEVYEWDDMVSFWIFYDPPHTRVISLHMKGKLMPYIHIPLHQIDPVDVREKMMEFVPEIKQEQGMVDVLERLLHM